MPPEILCSYLPNFPMAVHLFSMFHILQQCHRLKAMPLTLSSLRDVKDLNYNMIVFCLNIFHISSTLKFQSKFLSDSRILNCSVLSFNSYLLSVYVSYRNLSLRIFSWNYPVIVLLMKSKY